MSSSPNPPPSTTNNFLDKHPIARGVHDRAAAISFAWQEFQSLYLAGLDRIDLLNSVAGGFFGLIQHILLDSLLLNLSVLSDPSKSGEFENLSFDRLADEFESELRAKGAWSEANDLLAKFHDAVKDFKLHRNKRIAHGDVATQATPLGGVKLGQLRGAVQLAFDTFNAHCTPLSGANYAFEDSIITGDAESLVWAIGAAKQYRAMYLWLWKEPLEGRDAADLVKSLRTNFYDSPVPGVKPEPLV